MTVQQDISGGTLYKCARCKRYFVAAHFGVVRQATGRTVTCCGTPAFWKKNLSVAEAGEYARTGVVPGV